MSKNMNVPLLHTTQISLNNFTSALCESPEKRPFSNGELRHISSVKVQAVTRNCRKRDIEFWPANASINAAASNFKKT